jgi:2-oxo-4-hydroxy-4-carboxy-5-ureidoimidazoline decarboxylase
MMSYPPPANLNDIILNAEHAWSECTESDWLEAFSHHPKIGDVSALREKFATTADWASKEQSGTKNASEGILSELADLNNRYEQRFGFIFIVCATGKTAGEMLDLLKSRIHNTRDAEIRIAAAEQLKITKLRLRKLLAS